MHPLQFTSAVFSGHIGTSVSALVDGQLSPDAEERAWNHVMSCPGCRRLVENEGWTKSRLRSTGTAPSGVSESLIGALYDVSAWAQVDEIERVTRRRRTSVALIGVGSVGVAVFGLVALTSPPAGRGELPGSPGPAMIHSDQLGSSIGASLGGVVGSTAYRTGRGPKRGSDSAGHRAGSGPSSSASPRASHGVLAHDGAR